MGREEEGRVGEWLPTYTQLATHTSSNRKEEQQQKKALACSSNKNCSIAPKEGFPSFLRNAIPQQSYAASSSLQPTGHNPSLHSCQNVNPSGEWTGDPFGLNGKWPCARMKEQDGWCPSMSTERW